MLEPRTTGECIIHTTKGSLNIRLWCNELPVITRKFLESCQLGKLDGEAISQVSPNEKTVYISNKTSNIGNTNVENDARIRFNKKGVFGWDNESKRWFITLQEYTMNDIGKKAIVGTIQGTSLYTLRAIVDDSEKDPHGNFLYPAKIKEIELSIPYFKDLPTKVLEPPQVLEVQKKKSTRIRLSYDEDDVDDEDSNDMVPTKRLKIKIPKGIKMDKGPVDTMAESERITKDEPQDDISECTRTMETDKDMKKYTKLTNLTDNPSSNEDQENAQKTERELKTLELLSMFQRNMKGKGILKRGD